MVHGFHCIHDELVIARTHVSKQIVAGRHLMKMGNVRFRTSFQTHIVVGTDPVQFDLIATLFSPNQDIVSGKYSIESNRIVFTMGIHFQIISDAGTENIQIVVAVLHLDLHIQSADAMQLHTVMTVTRIRIPRAPGSRHHRFYPIIVVSRVKMNTLSRENSVQMNMVISYRGKNFEISKGGVSQSHILDDHFVMSGTSSHKNVFNQRRRKHLSRQSIDGRSCQTGYLNRIGSDFGDLHLVVSGIPTDCQIGTNEVCDNIAGKHIAIFKWLHGDFTLFHLMLGDHDILISGRV